MPARRRHEKSHHGCLPCKKRHVKCDEQHPICRACKKYGVQCEYASSIYASWRQKRANCTQDTNQQIAHNCPSSLLVGSPASSTPSASSGILPGDLSTSEILNLELMHHYSTSTWSTLSDDNNAMHLKQILVPQEAMSHRFALHGILALAALHLAWLKPDQRSRYLPSALSHYDLAVSSYRLNLQDITEENCTMLFAFSSVLVQFAFGLPHVQPPPAGRDIDSVAAITEIFHLLRGTALVVDAGREWIKHGTLGYLLRRKYINASAEDEPPEIQDAFRKVRLRLDVDSSMSEEKVEAYRETMERLLQCAATASVDPEDKAIPMIVPSTVRPTFVSALEAREPLALVLEAYHAVLLHGLDDFWWGKGWGRRIIIDISNELNDDWKELVAWPLEKVSHCK